MLLTLDDVLDPISLDEFARDYWERRSLYVPGCADKARGLFTLDRLRSLAAALDARHGGLKAGFKDAAGEHAEMSIGAHQIEPVVAAGMTVMADRLDELDAPLRQLADDTKAKLGLPAAVTAGAFLSPASSGFGLHFDPVSNWIIQLEGVKRWRYSARPAVAFPSRAFVPDARQRREAGGPDGVPLEERELTPGDVLYLPPGAWHEPRAVGGPSLHVSMIASNASLLSLVVEAKEQSPGRAGQGAPGSAAWRWLPSAPLLERNEPAARGPIERELARRRDAVVKELRRLSAAELYDRWRAKTRVAGEPAARRAPLEKGTRLRHAEPLRYALEAGEGRALLLLRDGQVVASLPGASRAFVDRLLEREHFLAGDALAWTGADWGDLRAALETLVALGFLAPQRD